MAHEQTPYRVGICLDWALGTRAMSDQLDATRMAFAEATETGLLDRNVEIVMREVRGTPFGMVSATHWAWHDLAGLEGCLAILGPFMPPAAATLAADVNRVGVPTLSYAGSDQFAGDYCFKLAHTSLSDEGAFLADVLRRLDAKRFAVLYEDNLWGMEPIRQLRLCARELHLELITEQVIKTFATAEDAAHALRRATAQRADAIVYIGAGFALHNVIDCLESAGPLPRIILNSCFDMLLPELDGPIRKLPEIAGIGQTHEANATYDAMLNRFDKRYGRRPDHVFTALGYDLAHMVALGLSQARPHSRDGLKDALEKIRRIPATIGAPGTQMGFLPWDHCGYKGEYLLLREMCDGKNRPVKLDTALTSWGSGS